MSTDIGVIYESGSRGVPLYLNRYWGGSDNGPCLQLTATMEKGQYGYVQISASDAIALLPALKDLINDALERKRNEAEEAIRQNKELSRSIVKEMADVASMAINQPIFECAATLCLGAKSIDPGSNA